MNLGNPNISNPNIFLVVLCWVWVGSGRSGARILAARNQKKLSQKKFNLEFTPAWSFVVIFLVEIQQYVVERSFRRKPRRAREAD